MPEQPRIQIGSAGAVQQVILLGGAGDVGTRLVRLLFDQTNAVVTTVSRRARQDVGQMNSRLLHMSYDLSGDGNPIKSAKAIVVNLTEATTPTLARQVIESGGWFLETSASPGYLRAMTDGLAQAIGPGTAIMCVGAAPGLTNLLAAEITDKAPETAQIDIGVEMGMGRHYGVAGTEWFLRTAGQAYPVIIDHTLQNVAPGDLKRRIAFGEGGPLRLAIGYGFAEQVVIAESSARNLKTVRSFVALDPPWLTRMLSILISTGLGPAIGSNAPKFTRWLRRAPVLGRTRSRLVVEGFDNEGQLTGQVRLETGDQAEATAAMIFATVQSVLEHRGTSSHGKTTIVDHLCLEMALGVLRRVLPETRITARFGNKIANFRRADR